MTDRIQIGHLYPTKPLSKPQEKNTASPNEGASFEQVFKTAFQTQKLKFSSHASERMKTRGIQLSSDEMDKLAGAVNDAKGKGSKASLVLLNNVAYIVSVSNNTVVTAVDSSSMQNHVFTQIDSAIII
jgi:flagellar operon protein